MDEIPGARGVVLGYFEKAHIYHHTPDGLLIGQMAPGEAAGSVTGWMDNPSAVAVQRDPRGGLLDVFGEDSWLNRCVWYRVDDPDLETLRAPMARRPRPPAILLSRSGASLGPEKRSGPAVACRALGRINLPFIMPSSPPARDFPYNR